MPDTSNTIPAYRALSNARIEQIARDEERRIATAQIIAEEIAAMNARLAEIRCRISRQLPTRIEDFDGYSWSGLCALRVRVARRGGDVSEIDARLAEIGAAAQDKIMAEAAKLGMVA